MKKEPKPGIVTVPRIIGIICIAVAIACYFARLGKWLSLAIAGLILLFAPTGYSRKVFTILIESFRLGKWFALSMLYDAFFWLGFILVLIGCYSTLTSKAQALASQLPQELTQELLQANASLMSNMINTMIITGIIAFITTIIIYTIFKGLVWLTLFEQKPKLQFFKKFLLLNAGWWAAWTAIAILVATGIRPEAILTAAPVIALISMHLTIVLHVNFLQTGKLGQSFGNAFSQGVGKIYHFILPYTYLFLVYVVLFQVYRLIPLQGKISFAVSMLFVIAYLAWVRKFIKTIIQSIVQKDG